MIVTDRLLLRPWREADLPAFAALNADPEVRRFFPGLLSRAASDAQAARIQAALRRNGFGFWAAEVPGVAACIGFIGLSPVPFEASFSPAVEIGWRLARAHWGRGYATEGARAALAFGFETLALAQIVSFTATANRPSRRVMERIGMRRDAGSDFDHPMVAPGDPLRRHVLYRLAAGDWRAAAAEPM